MNPRTANQKPPSSSARNFLITNNSKISGACKYIYIGDTTQGWLRNACVSLHNKATTNKQLKYLKWHFTPGSLHILGPQSPRHEVEKSTKVMAF